MEYDKIGSREMTDKEKEHMDYVSNLMKIVNEQGHFADEEAKDNFTICMREDKEIMDCLTGRYIMPEAAASRFIDILNDLVDNILTNAAKDLVH